LKPATALPDESPTRAAVTAFGAPSAIFNVPNAPPNVTEFLPSSASTSVRSSVFDQLTSRPLARVPEAPSDSSFDQPKTGLSSLASPQPLSKYV